MIGENYYLSFYQAILDNNLIKLVKLYNLTNEEKLNYPEEYPHLDANEIFKATKPEDFISSLFGIAEYKDLYLKYNNAINPLTTAENIIIREKSFLELLEHPLIDYCPNDRSSIIDNLLAISYSRLITKEEVTAKLTTLINQSFIIDDVLLVTAISTTIDSNKPLSIALIDEKMESYDPTSSTSSGYYCRVTNSLVVTNEDAKLNLDLMIHELTHKTMKELFDNGLKPYNNESLNDKYHSAIKNTLLNVQGFIKQDFGLSINFKDQNNTWQMGKILSSTLFPEYLADNETQEFSSLFKQYNLNIDDKFSWLGGYSPLGIALSYHRFELASSLVKAGATIKPIIINKVAELNNTDILNWILENHSTIDINHQDCEGMTALDYASDPQIIKTLISAGANAYQPHFEPICSVDPACQDTEEDSTIITEQLHALKTLLIFYSQLYHRKEEDSESIVRLPQIIAEGLYKGKIVKVLEPLAEYWQEVISPAAVSYQERHDTSKICLAPLDYADFF